MSRGAAGGFMVRLWIDSNGTHEYTPPLPNTSSTGPNRSSASARASNG